jgi:2-iminobutanoate/2-iminopropanoate deaminase
MNRRVIRTAILGAAIVASAIPVLAGAAGKSGRKAVNPPGTAADLPFSNGVVVGNTLYLSGQEALVDGKPIPGGITAETEEVLNRIKKIVELAGFQMTDVVSVNVYLADIGDFAEMTRVYKTFFPEPRPARTTVAVAGLGAHAHIEISAIAVKQR